MPKSARFAVITEMMIGAGAATVGGVAYTRTRRAKLYRELAGRVVAITSTKGKSTTTALTGQML